MQLERKTTCQNKMFQLQENKCQLFLLLMNAPQMISGIRNNETQLHLVY